MARYDIALIVTVSKLYYLNHLKQEDIAVRLKISRAMVSLILNEAKRLGIVEFKINNPQERNEEVALKLNKLFPDIEFVVVPSFSKDEQVLREFIASRAVDVINEQLRNGENIGISWGRTCYAIMSGFIAKSALPLSHIIPMVGGSNKNLPRFQLNELVRVFAASMNAQPHFIHAPALPSSQEDFHLYMKSSTMKEICSWWNNIDLAIMSIGPPPVHEEFDGSQVLVSHQEKWLSRENDLTLPVGNMCARYFDVRGNFVEDDMQRRIIAIPFDLMKRIPKVIAIAAGPNRVFSVVGALQTGIVKTLVIDEVSALTAIDLLNRLKTSDLEKEVFKLYGISSEMQVTG